jgi:hypothetical protein
MNTIDTTTDWAIWAAQHGRNSYALDGKCHNANFGTYGHECGKLAKWLGIKCNGWATGFCENCKNNGDERALMAEWVKADK